jgi:hypothetical protein
MTQRDVIQVKEGVELCYLILSSWVNAKPKTTIKSNLSPALGVGKYLHTDDVILQILTSCCFLLLLIKEFTLLLVALISSEWRNKQASCHPMELHVMVYFGGKGSQGEGHLFH